MLDIRLLREDPEGLGQALARRGIDDIHDVLAAILADDGTRRAAISEVNDLKARRNEVSKQVGALKRAGESADDLIAEMRDVGAEIDQLDTRVAALEASIETALLALPNAPHPDVQPGGEEDADVLREWGECPTFAFPVVPHWELGEALGILDLARGSKVSGSGFPVLRGAGARLQRGLIDYMLDLHVSKHGYEELRVPYLVTRDSMTGTGQLPKFEDESYQTERDGLWLIPTAEVPVTNLHRDELLTADDLPIRYTAYSPCFRREAGAAGKDTRGLLRVHQFDKVELVRYETPERSPDALEEMTREACSVLERLGLHHRVIRLAGGDLGFSSRDDVRHRSLGTRGGALAGSVELLHLYGLPGATGEHPLSAGAGGKASIRAHPERIGPGASPVDGGAPRDLSGRGWLGTGSGCVGPARRVRPHRALTAPSRGAAGRDDRTAVDVGAGGPLRGPPGLVSRVYQPDPSVSQGQRRLESPGSTPRCWPPSTIPTRSPPTKPSGSSRASSSRATYP